MNDESGREPSVLDRYLGAIINGLPGSVSRFYNYLLRDLLIERNDYWIIVYAQKALFSRLITDLKKPIKRDRTYSVGMLESESERFVLEGLFIYRFYSNLDGDQKGKLIDILEDNLGRLRERDFSLDKKELYDHTVLTIATGLVILGKRASYVKEKLANFEIGHVLVNHLLDDVEVLLNSADFSEVDKAANRLVSYSSDRALNFYKARKADIVGAIARSRLLDPSTDDSIRIVLADLQINHRLDKLSLPFKAETILQVVNAADRVLKTSRSSKPVNIAFRVIENLEGFSISCRGDKQDLKNQDPNRPPPLDVVASSGAWGSIIQVREAHRYYDRINGVPRQADLTFYIEKLVDNKYGNLAALVLFSKFENLSKDPKKVDRKYFDNIRKYLEIAWDYLDESQQQSLIESYIGDIMTARKSTQFFALTDLRKILSDDDFQSLISAGLVEVEEQYINTLDPELRKKLLEVIKACYNALYPPSETSRNVLPTQKRQLPGIGDQGRGKRSTVRRKFIG